ncbi:DnaJ-domain-containing protein [Athelia psychrophila]|uniref:DnaJ-domain-containing protein n=1 Tax=Athelia psychrophila TaxID=1759441 RepID=A0A166LZ66_9AGAM|nr:DnaJ-domain-containing protein [Fibularhizoctonia sp. CBS 109695]
MFQLRRAPKSVLRPFLRTSRPFSSSSRRGNHYETLGVPQTATPGQIKSSFYRLSRQYHPDINKAPGAQETFQKVSEAWATLKDEREKRAYDRRLKESAMHSMHSNRGPGHGPGFSGYGGSTPEWSHHGRRHTRQSAEWSWTYTSRTSSGSQGGSGAFRGPGGEQKHDPFANPFVQRATGKARADTMFSSAKPSGSDHNTHNTHSTHNTHASWMSGAQSNTWRSAKSTRAEREHAKEAAATSNSGLFKTVPTIGITLLFLVLAHGWGADA